MLNSDDNADQFSEELEEIQALMQEVLAEKLKAASPKVRRILQELVVAKQPQLTVTVRKVHTSKRRLTRRNLRRRRLLRRRHQIGPEVGLWMIAGATGCQKIFAWG